MKEVVSPAKRDKAPTLYRMSPSQMAHNPIHECTVQHQRARENRKKLEAEEDRWMNEIRQAETNFWKVRYTSAIAALEKERETCVQLEKALEKTRSNLSEVAAKLDKNVSEKAETMQLFADFKNMAKDPRFPQLLKMWRLFRGDE